MDGYRMGRHILGAWRFPVIPINPETVRTRMHRDGASGAFSRQRSWRVGSWACQWATSRWWLSAERGGMSPLLTRSLLVKTVAFI